MPRFGPSLVFLLALLLAQRNAAGEIRVAAAADLQFALQDAAAAFENQTGRKVGVTYGSSGNFFAQIQNGAPFDLFFSADVEYPRRLEAEGLAEPGTLYEYAIGRIVLWVPASSPVDVGQRRWEALLDPTIQKIAIANPAHAPYGRAAIAAMEKAGIFDKVKAKLVYGENISQAAQFVESGNAQAGIIALSLALAPPMRDKGRRWEIPESDHPPIEQAAVVLKSQSKNDAARQFLEFVKSARGRAIFENHGFRVPVKNAPASGVK